MAVYQNLLDNNYAVGPSINATNWNGTRGKQIMDLLAASAEPMPMLEDRIANAMDIFNTTMQGVWTWNPRSASAAGAGMLDSASLSGECAQLVSAFKVLLRSPAPYGFGLSADDVASVEWPTNESVILFVVKHNGPVFGLYQNVLKPGWAKLGGSTRFEPLYGWGNHKVLKVSFNGYTRYFDPCYNNVYLLPEEMADATLTRAETVIINRAPMTKRYIGRTRFGRPIAFDAISSANPEAINQRVKTLSNNDPVLIGSL